ncbi:hypothetical protein B0H14DRAFT_3886367 [Mycena olivaceomarginata]|nr:hypothetical protein B0H14DRAFT_3886367 [Mycena olivaceomarginata]
MVPRADARRMPGAGDEDYDRVNRWARRVWAARIIMNNRPFLAVYTLMLWVCFGLMFVPGYLTYKRSLNLDGKINQAWSQGLGAAGRLTIQNQLGCGHFSPFIEATVSSTCYARSALPGCKAAFLAFESKTLMRWYAVAFGLVPVHIGLRCRWQRASEVSRCRSEVLDAIEAAFAAALRVLESSPAPTDADAVPPHSLGPSFLLMLLLDNRHPLLCANHVTYRFGKGMMPKAYRLSREAVAAVAEGYAVQLAEQYGPDAAAHMLSTSNLGSGANSPYECSPLGSAANSNVELATMPYAGRGDGGGTHVKYDSVGAGGVRDTSI